MTSLPSSMWATTCGCTACGSVPTSIPAYTLGGGIDSGRGWGRSDKPGTPRRNWPPTEPIPTGSGLGDRDLATPDPHPDARRRLSALGRHGRAVPTLATRRAAAAGHRQSLQKPMSRSPNPVGRKMNTSPSTSRNGGCAIAHQTGARFRADPDRATAAPGYSKRSRRPTSCCWHRATRSSASARSWRSRIRGALRTTAAPVVGVSPVIDSKPLRGMADGILTAIRGGHIGGSHRGTMVAQLNGILDGWLIADGDAVDTAVVDGITVGTAHC